MSDSRSVRSGSSRLWPVVLGVLLVAAACSKAGGPAPGDTGGAEPQTSLRSLTSIQDLREQFNRDDGLTRLVLLISPT